MDPNNKPVPTPEEQALLEAKMAKDMGELHKLTLSRKEWTIIYNILQIEGFDEKQHPIFRQYTLNDAKIMLPIIDQLQAIVAIDSHIPKSSIKES